MTETALELATQLIIQFEGFRSDPYQDTAGIWTIGFGTTHIRGAAVTSATTRVNQIQAASLMADELAPICATVASLCPANASPQQIAACTSFAYNEGLAALAGSTLLRHVNGGLLSYVTEDFMKWVYVHINGVPTVSEGLVKRRQAEVQLWNTN